MRLFKKNSGQIIVEYILLLLIAVTSAMIMTKSLIGRRDSADESGAIIKSWNKIIQTIGNDLPDCPNQTNFNSASCPNP